MSLPQENLKLIKPSNMNQFPYLLLGNVYFPKSITVGMLIGESTVICSETETKEEGMQVDFLPFHTGEVKLCNAIKGSVRLLNQGLMLVFLSEPIGRTLAQLFKDEDNEKLLSLNPNGLFSFMDQHLEKNEEMNEMRSNGFLEDNLTIIGYLQHYDLSLSKKSLSYRSSVMSYSQTFSSTFGHNEDAFRRHFIFQTEVKNGDLNNNSFNEDEGFLLYEKKGRLIDSNNSMDLMYKIDDMICQKGTPLFIKKSADDNQKDEYILLGFHMPSKKEMDQFSMLNPRVSSTGSNKSNSSSSKGILFTFELYMDIIRVLKQKTTKIHLLSSLPFTKSIFPTLSTYHIVNFYFFNIFSCKGLISKLSSQSSIFKILSELYKIPQEHLQFSFGSSELSSYKEPKADYFIDSSIDKQSFGIINQDDTIEVNLFCEVNLNTFTQYLSDKITQKIKDVKAEHQNPKKLLLKGLFKELMQYEELSSHFYGLLFNDLKGVLIHQG